MQQETQLTQKAPQVQETAARLQELEAEAELLRKRKSKNPSRWTEVSEDRLASIESELESLKAADPDGDEKVDNTEPAGIEQEPVAPAAEEKKRPAKGASARLYHVRVRERGSKPFDPMTGKPNNGHVIYLTPGEFADVSAHQNAAGIEIVEVVNDPTRN